MTDVDEFLKKHRSKPGGGDQQGALLLVCWMLLVNTIMVFVLLILAIAQETRVQRLRKAFQETFHEVQQQID